MAATLFLILTSLSLLCFLILIFSLLRRRLHVHVSTVDPDPLPLADKKKKKKRGKRKNKSVCPEMSRAAAEEKELSCPLPFASLGSGMQRKMKERYEDLVKANRDKALTMVQVGEFVNCLVDAKNELQQKSEVIKRSFKIKKALLLKAERSSFDRLSQQIYKLESEHKRIEQDAAVYNLLQEQLKLSPAYKTMLEISAKMESKEPPDETMELPDISFEELLAQEKKDSFWQKNGKMRSFASG